MEEKKIWIVMKGEYSDTDVECVFSSKEKAEEYLNKVGNSRRSIIECNIDDEAFLKSKYCNMFRVKISEGGFYENKGAIVDDFEMNEIKDYFSMKENYDNSITWTFYIEADRADKAIKIASERLMQLKALPYTWKKDYDIQLKCPMYNYFTKELIDAQEPIY